MIEAIKLALEALESNRRTHYYCEDTWYSCPKHEDGCANDAEGDECNCGADEANLEIDYAITSLRQAIAEAEQEPVAHCVVRPLQGYESIPQTRIEWKNGRPVAGPLYTSPPQRQPLTDDAVFELADTNLYEGDKNYGVLAFARAIEDAHGIKGEA